ncbi:hypothetical protein SLEP1_g21264 [Rubroshorea leprosula]|uniref:Uncharacterized protein n=1 Tax=Rubroshorea leprosula TaxID=152421 RepID=A0AAV5JEJ7_9ROSI|nr:hypothetical protein SLEP1_g21264 [Rubroshorea leprosula]
MPEFDLLTVYAILEECAIASFIPFSRYLQVKFWNQTHNVKCTSLSLLYPFLFFFFLLGLFV